MPGVLLGKVVPVAGTIISFFMYLAPSKAVMTARRRGALGVREREILELVFFFFFVPSPLVCCPAFSSPHDCLVWCVFSGPVKRGDEERKNGTRLSLFLEEERNPKCPLAAQSRPEAPLLLEPLLRALLLCPGPPPNRDNRRQSHRNSPGRRKRKNRSRARESHAAFLFRSHLLR